MSTIAIGKTVFHSASSVGILQADQTGLLRARQVKFKFLPSKN